MLLLAACGGAIGGDPSAVGGPGNDQTGLDRGDGSEPGLGNPGDGPQDGSGPGGVPPAEDIAECADRVLPDQPLRRLSSSQYHNTLRDLFGAELALDMIMGSLFPVTQIDSGFEGDAEANVVNTAESNAIEDNAARIAASIVAGPDPFMQSLCGLSAGYGGGDVDGCVDGFIDDFGARAYRRPLTEGERGIARGLYDALRAEQPAVEAFAGLVQLFVQAPALLYRVERGADEVSPGLLRLTDHEMASRLSYFFLDSMPDEELFTEADAGRLSTPAEIATQAERLMASPRFEAVLANFHRDWLRLYELETAAKDPALYPEFTEAVRTSLQEEASRLVNHIMQDGDGSIATLLGTREIPVNGALANFYGTDGGSDPDAWSPAELDDRRGLLTLASFMATQAEADKTSPIHRGAFFQSEVLCNPLPNFPGNIDTQTPLQDTSMLPTARERLSPLLAEGSTCAGCHTLFNPTGLAFENYDAAGLWRDQENGADIDASGTVELDGVAHDFESPLELMERVAESEQARDCYTLQWYRAALGRREFAEDACGLELVQQAASSNGGDIRQLLVALTQTDGFLYRTVPTEVEP